MVSAVPSAISAISPASNSGHWTEGVFYVRKPDLNDETRRLIGKKRAADAWDTFFDLLRWQERRGKGRRRRHDTREQLDNRTTAVREAAGRGVLEVGIGAMARRAGITTKAMRRQIAAIEALGLWVTFRPATTIVRDSSGRITRKVTGRTPPVRIHLTILSSHLRPARSGSKVSIEADAVMDTLSPTSIPLSQTSLGQTSGSSEVSQAGHSAGKADQEGGSVVEVNVSPEGVIVTTAQEPAATPSLESPTESDHQEETCQVSNVRPPEETTVPVTPTPARSAPSPVAACQGTGVRPERGSGVTGGSWLADYHNLIGKGPQDADDAMQAYRARRRMDALRATYHRGAAVRVA